MNDKNASGAGQKSVENVTRSRVWAWGQGDHFALGNGRNENLTTPNVVKGLDGERERLVYLCVHVRMCVCM